ncbi:hypothetical protein ACHAO4_008820 [Trichoderma viride]
MTLPRCTRCIDKGLSCEYAAVTMPRMAPYSIMTTNTTTTAATTDNGRSGNLHDGATDFRSVPAKDGRTQLGLHPDPGRAPVSEPMVMSTASPPLEADAPVLPPSVDSSDTWTATMQADLGLGADMAFTIASMIEPCQNIMRFMGNVDMNISHDAAVAEAEDARLRNPINSSGSHSDVLAHDVSSCMLTSRRGLTANAILATKIIFGQVSAYPALMVSGLSLPPFIHSKCALDDSSTTVCLIYTVEIFLEIRFRQQDFRRCQKFANSPLPCIRDLWEVPSTYEWKKRYNAFLRDRSADKILVLSDYQLSQQLSAEELISGTTAGDNYGSITKDVLRWCEGLDQLGTLIILASSLIKYELDSSEIAVGYLKVS